MQGGSRAAVEGRGKSGSRIHIDTLFAIISSHRFYYTKIRDSSHESLPMPFAR